MILHPLYEITQITFIFTVGFLCYYFGIRKDLSNYIEGKFKK